jgi:hypothetical protein
MRRHAMTDYNVSQGDEQASAQVDVSAGADLSTGPTGVTGGGDCDD